MSLCLAEENALGSIKIEKNLTFLLPTFLTVKFRIPLNGSLPDTIDDVQKQIGEELMVDAGFILSRPWGIEQEVDLPPLKPAQGILSEICPKCENTDCLKKWALYKTAGKYRAVIIQNEN